MLRFGRLRKLLREKALNIELWDHGYNLYKFKPLSWLLGPFTFRTGLSDGNGRMTGKDFDIVVSNNSPKEYSEIFSRSPENHTLKNILTFDVVVFKNCFPTTKIETKEKLEKYKNYYKNIIENISKYPNKFIVFTPPSLRREMTTPEWASNARELSEWLIRQETKNVKIFNFFDLLADKNTNTLRRDYCNLLFFDSHPNIKANRDLGKEFVKFLIRTTSPFGYII